MDQLELPLGAITEDDVRFVCENRPGRARNTDPDTSHDASFRVARFSGSARLAVLTELEVAADHGRTDYELGERLGLLRTTTGKRRHELGERAMVADAGRRRRTDTGASAIVWCITDRGRAALAAARETFGA